MDTIMHGTDFYALSTSTYGKPRLITHGDDSYFISMRDIINIMQSCVFKTKMVNDEIWLEPILDYKNLACGFGESYEDVDLDEECDEPDWELIDPGDSDRR